MSDIPRAKLAELIAAFGVSLVDDPRRCEALLRDKCPHNPREVHVLVQAQLVQAPQQLQAASGAIRARIGQLIQQLHNERGVDLALAEWAIVTWALALNLVRSSDIPSMLNENSTSQNKGADSNRVAMAPTLTQESYTVLANADTPALIIYILDISASMNERLGNKRRIDVVSDALGSAVSQMVGRSTKGSRVSPRYRIAMLAYSDQVYDVLGGVETIKNLAQKGIPTLTPQRSTNTAAAFEVVERLLQQELPTMQNCPAPLVCHMTDGEYNGNDPLPIVKRIMQMHVPDGSVLVENIFISDSLIRERITNPQAWAGITPSTNLTSDYARRLRDMSSPLPASYRAMMSESGYSMSHNAVMLLPGMSPDLVEMGFVMSSATPVAR
jgi:hypothetical protein